MTTVGNRTIWQSFPSGRFLIGRSETTMNNHHPTNPAPSDAASTPQEARKFGEPLFKALCRTLAKSSSVIDRSLDGTGAMR